MRRRLPRLAATLAAGSALVLAVATGAGARPDPPAPEHPAAAPPPAWIETARGERWLAFSFYCWTSATRGLCADYIDPRRRDDLPRFVVRRGEVVRIHLAFVPTEAYVTVGRKSRAYEPSRILEVPVGRGGVLEVHVYGRRGDAGYVARLLVR